MCGIYGLFPALNGGISKNFQNALRHRGPDDQGLLQLSNGLLGHTRLSIIDLSSAGHQPMVDQTGRFTIVYNGEVYNYKVLYNKLISLGEKFISHTDTEVVLTGYRVWGCQLFSMLRGMFAFAIHDNETGKVVLVRDRLGIKPLLYFKDGSYFAFASELKALLACGVVNKKIDSVSLISFLRFGAVSQPRTMIEGVMNLLPGYMLTRTSDGSTVLERYYDTSSVNFSLTESTYEDAVIDLRDRLEDATRAHLISDVDVGCFLSGGIDSTAVLALMQKEVHKPIHAISLGFDTKSKVCDESLIAERSAKSIGARFTRSIVTESIIADCFGDFLSAIDQPSMDGFNTFLVSMEAAKHVKVVLSGLGGDELFAGYPHFATILAMDGVRNNFWDTALQALHAIRPNRFTLDATMRGKSPASALQQSRIIYSDNEISWMIGKHDIIPSIVAEDSSLTTLQAISYAEITGYLRNTLLRDSDVVSMWHGLEVRPVLLDSQLVDFALRLPDAYKVRNGRLKAVFVDAVKDLIPNEVLALPKRGFEIPFDLWMNGVLRDRLMAYWESNSAKEIFSKTYRHHLIYRTEKRKLRRRDWLSVIIIGWNIGKE